jgi:cytochrome oxidase assembly protein ShyY1
VRTLLRPKWVFGHVLALTLVVLFVFLGMWQLRRHDERAERNAAMTLGLQAPVAPLDALPEGGREYRRARVTGVYAPEEEVLLTPRTEHGPGHHVLTPLWLPDGRLLVVDRGWIPFQLDTPPIAEAPAPAGEVILEGVLLPATKADAKAVRDDEGRVVRLAAVDPAAVAGDQAIEDVYLLVEAPQPEAAGLPVPASAPTPDSGPHLSYAAQWFIFALVGVVGYPLLLRRTVQERGHAGEGEAPAR